MYINVDVGCHSPQASAFEKLLQSPSCSVEALLDQEELIQEPLVALVHLFPVCFLPVSVSFEAIEAHLRA